MAEFEIVNQENSPWPELQQMVNEKLQEIENISARIDKLDKIIEINNQSRTTDSTESNVQSVVQDVSAISSINSYLRTIINFFFFILVVITCISVGIHLYDGRTFIDGNLLMFGIICFVIYYIAYAVLIKFKKITV